MRAVFSRLNALMEYPFHQQPGEDTHTTASNHVLITPQTREVSKGRADRSLITLRHIFHSFLQIGHHWQILPLVAENERHDVSVYDTDFR